MDIKIVLLILLSLIIISCNKASNKTAEFLKKYDQIRLASYNTHRDVYRNKNDLKIEEDTLQISEIKFIDNIILNKYFSEKIVNILFLKEKECLVADCYNPRHILFFYKENKIVDYYEFCAECGGNRNSKNINFPQLCTEKGDKLIEVFKEMKLKNNGEETENYKYF